MQRHAPAWLVGITYVPFGLYNGFIAIAMPFLLTARGVPLDRVLGLQFTILLPSFLSFLITPVVDSGLSRRAWAIICACAAGLALFGGVVLLPQASKPSAPLLAGVLLFGYLAAQLYASAMGGMIPNLVAEADTGSVSAWLNTAYLGGTGVGGWLGSILVPHIGLQAAAPVLAMVVFLPSLLLFIIGREHRVPRKVVETMRRLVPDLIAVSRTRAALVGLLIFTVPAATFAAQNSFSGLGRDFHTSDNATTLLTGWGSAVLCSAGAMFGGWLANRMDRRVMFVGSGLVAAFASIGMACGARSSEVFVAGTTVYYLLAGINYAAASAVAFDIMGVDNPLSATQYAILIAASNLAIETVIKGDQWGYGHAAARGLLLTDAAFSLITGTVLLLVIRLWGGSGRDHRMNVDAAAELL